MRGFGINVECYTDLSISDLWPDHDEPENPTTTDVETLIEQCGGILRVITDWDLGPLEVTVIRTNQ